MGAAGYWGDTAQQFRPGISCQMFEGTDPSTIQGRLAAYYTPANLAFWLKEGTYANFYAKVNWKRCYANENVAPSDHTDPDDPAYDWSYLDSLFSQDIFTSNGIGPGIQINFMVSQGRSPNWYGNLGYEWTNSNGDVQVRWDLAAARQIVKDFYTAFKARYTGNEKFWAIFIGESVNGSSSAFPSGFTADLQNRGYCEIANYVYDLYGGTKTVVLGANSLSVFRLYAYPIVGYHHPDPKMFTSGCTPSCTSGSSRYYMQQFFDQCYIGTSTESNGMLANVTWPNGVTNPWGYNSSTTPHPPTAEEVLWYFSNTGVIPAHVLSWTPAEWGGGVPNLSLANIIAANNRFLAGGSDIFPALPADYDTGAPSGGSGTYTFVAAGTLSTSGSPGQPAGKSAGDLLICAAAVRSGAETPNAAPAGWQILGSNTRVAVYGRIATNDANDNISSHDFWSGTSSNNAQIAAFSGDVYTDLNTIVVSVAYGSGQSNDIPSGALTLATDNCLVIGIGAKQKSATSDGSTITSPTGLDNRIQLNWANGDVVGFVWDYTIQTTAANIDAGIWDQSVNENAFTGSIILALQVNESGGVDTTAPAHASPDNLTGTAQGQTSILWEWDQATDAVGVTHYDLQTSTDDTNWSFLATITKAEFEALADAYDGGYLQTGLAANTAYYLRYRARDAAGNASAYSSSATETTDSPADTTDPTYSGITGATYDASTGDTTLAHTQGTDNVSSQGNLRYNIYGAYDGAAMSYATPLFGPLAAQTAFVIADGDIADGDWEFGIRCLDEAGNEDTNTATEAVTVGSTVVTGTIEACELNSGTVQSGTAYLFLSPQGEVMSVNVSAPAQSGIPVTFNVDGSVDISNSGQAGDYDWLMLNSDGTWRASGTVTLS